MGLDIYVMPVWKFKAGDFASPLERLGLRVTTITPGGRITTTRGRTGHWIDRWKAKYSTWQLRRAIEQEVGHRVRWNDKGEIAYAEQSNGIEPLRAFARWSDLQDVFPTFDPPPDKNFYVHPAYVSKLDRPRTHPQLLNHSFHTGYLLPTEMEQVVYVEPFQGWGGHIFAHAVGSSVELNRELADVTNRFAMAKSSGQIAPLCIAPVEAALEQLSEVVQLGLRENLPVIFCG